MTSGRMPPGQIDYSRKRRRGRRTLLALCALLAVAALAEPAPGPRRVLLFGDSLTAGYGVEPDQAFPALIQARLDSLAWPVRIVNAGLAGETTAAGLRRIDWILRPPVDVFILALGGNDGLRGLPPDQAAGNLQGILDRVQARFPAADLVVAGVRLPPNLGEPYIQAFQAVFPRLAQANGAVLIPRLLEGVGGDRELMLDDGIHPNAAGHRRVAETVWAALEPLLAPPASTGAAQDLEGRFGADAPAAGDAEGDGQ